MKIYKLLFHQINLKRIPSFGTFVVTPKKHTQPVATMKENIMINKQIMGC
jgi:hypothetical protein